MNFTIANVIKTIFFILSICFDVSVFSQTTFRETFKSNIPGRPSQVLRLPNHGSVVVGGQLDSIIYCLRLDSIGNVLLSKRFASQFSERAIGLVTKDEGLILFSHSFQGNHQNQGGLIIKCNRNGDIIWTKRLRSKNYPSVSPQVLYEDSHGGAILVYNVNDNISYTSTTIEIVRITSDGTLDWYTTFDSQQSSTDIYNPKCIVEANNEFLIGGNINYQWLYYTDGALLRLNSKGKVLAFKRISSHYLFLTLSKLWIANNMLCAFGEFEGEYGYYKKCFFYFKDTSGQIHGDVVHNNVFSVQHYLELHKYLLPADLSGAYYEKNGSYINVAGNGYNYEISKFDSLGRICPDFALPKYDPLFHSKLFTTSDKSYAVYTDSVYLEDAEVSESRVAEEAIICRGSANENPNPIKLDNQRVNVDGSKPMLFPNPARDIITLKYSSTSFQEVYVAITTSDGITMQSAKLLLNPGINMQPIGIESLSSGLYLLRIKEHDKLTVLKFIKSN